jgi:uncharacterized protein Yka (UPF0111/DUF47 family)
MTPMIGKSQIVETLGERSLLLPNLVNEALQANDRAKYLMTLLQNAKAHADSPERAGANLRDERLACGLERAEFDDIVDDSVRENGSGYRIPRVAEVHHLLLDSVKSMLSPLEAAGPDPAVDAPAYRERFGKLSSLQAPAEDTVPPDFVSRIASAERSQGDSVHLLVMDLHKELNRLQGRIAVDTIDGARVYGLGPGDRALVQAFMSGLNRTSPLRFDHPGLATTATRTGGELLIQNDIGMTDAHVMVIRVAPPRVRLTYTDVHLRRLLFFRKLFSAFQVEWSDTQSKHEPRLEEELYHLCVGVFEAKTPEDLAAFLSFLGSRVVFLIDWNRARKRLKRLAPESVCLEVLRWAAEEECGHMAFLKLGADQLVSEAWRLAAPVQLQPGGPLAETLGSERTEEFLKFALKAASRGLRAGRSPRLVQDEIRAELRYYIDTIHQGLLDVASRHASLIVELAVSARDGLLVAAPAADRAFLERAARKAKRWESEADGQVNRLRGAPHREDTRAVFSLLEIADDVADNLEEAIFLLGLLPAEAVAGDLFARVQDLSELVLQGSREYLKSVETARLLERHSPREEMQDFLESVDRISDLEHQCDEAHRRAKAGILTFPGDLRQGSFLIEVADLLEDAADALAHSAMTLRDFILGDVMTR